MSLEDAPRPYIASATKEGTSSCNAVIHCNDMVIATELESFVKSLID